MCENPIEAEDAGVEAAAPDDTESATSEPEMQDTEQEQHQNEPVAKVEPEQQSAGQEEARVEPQIFQSDKMSAEGETVATGPPPAAPETNQLGSNPEDLDDSSESENSGTKLSCISVWAALVLLSLKFLF